MNDVIFKRNTRINHNMLFGSSTVIIKIEKKLIFISKF